MESFAIWQEPDSSSTPPTQAASWDPGSPFSGLQCFSSFLTGSRDLYLPALLKPVPHPGALLSLPKQDRPIPALLEVLRWLPFTESKNQRLKHSPQRLPARIFHLPSGLTSCLLAVLEAASCILPQGLCTCLECVSPHTLSSPLGFCSYIVLANSFSY